MLQVVLSLASLSSPSLGVYPPSFFHLCCFPPDYLSNPPPSPRAEGAEGGGGVSTGA